MPLCGIIGKPIDNKGTMLFRCMLKSTILLLILFSLFPALSYARGQQEQENALSRADELIAEKLYNEALDILIPFAQRNPRQFDEAQERIRHIIGIREEYNIVAQQLLDAMEEEIIDDPTILALTNYLFELDPQRIAETQDFINRTRDVALFRSNVRRLERILNEGQALVEQGNYAQALRTYADGLSIYQNEFFSGTYGAAMENRVRQRINFLNANIAATAQTANSLQEAVNALRALINRGTDLQNIAAYRDVYNRIAAEMDRFTTLRNSYAATNAEFREDLTLLRRNYPELGDRNFLAFAVRLMEGRSGTSDGMLGFFDTVWNTEISQARDMLDGQSQLAYSDVENTASLEDYTRIAARANLLAEHAFFPSDLLIRWGRYGNTPTNTLFNQNIPVSESEPYLKFRSRGATVPYWLSLGQLGTRLTAVPYQNTLVLWRNGGNGEELIRTEQAAITTLRQIRTEATSLHAQIQQENTGFFELENRFPDSGSLTYINGVSLAVENLINSLNAREEISSIAQYTIANELMGSRIASRETELSNASSLYTGTQRGNYLARYPTQAAADLTQTNAAIASDRESLQLIIDQHNREIASVAANSQIRELRDQATAMLSHLDNIGTQSRTMTTAATILSNDAANLRRDGDRLFAEAQAALARNDFTTAQSRIQQAATAYDQSLDREDDPATHDRRNTAVPNLDNAIATALNEEVQRQVDELVEQIRASYFNNEFEQAERLITRAENIWRQTQIIDNPDLVHWASMIRMGLRSGRTIPPTAPLFAEMSQLLSDAQRNYDEGRILLVSSRTEGEQRLIAARQNLVQVKLVYPMNEDAGILDLRIDQQLDPNWQVTFAARVEDARNRARNARPQVNQIQAVNDLRNFRTIDPQFINWGPIIEQAERDAGLLPPLPTEAEREEARQIAIRARSIIASGNTAQIREIQPEISRGMQLDPDNQELRELFTLAAASLRQGITVLNPAAERLFTQASQAVIQNNPIRAQQLLQEIYAINQDYRNVSKVVTLQRRVQAML